MHPVGAVTIFWLKKYCNSMTLDLATVTVADAHRLLSQKEISAVELAQAYLDVIAQKDGDIHAYLEVYEDVLDQARAADARIARGDMAPLTGIPLALKDNIVVEGRRATSASKILEGYVGVYDATVVAKLKTQGVVFLGRTNMDEFAMGSSTEHSAYGPTRNPHDLTRVPGGTSGGSAAAVAAHMALVAVGSDTGGSIRQPANFCGVVGLKPTYGAVSRYGLMAYGSSLDQIGSIGKTVADAEVLYQALAGHDPMDSTTVPDTLYASVRSRQVKAIGVPYNFIKTGLDPAVEKNFHESVERFKQLGFAIKEIDLPSVAYTLSAYYIVAPAEASANLARFDGVRYGLHVDGADLLGDYLATRGAGFGWEVKRRILLGTYVLSHGYYDAFYGRAEALRNELRADFTRVFADVDLILTPTSPVPAFTIGEKTQDPVAMYLADIFTIPANLAGVPGIALPTGTTEVNGKALPLGIQLMAPHGGEHLLFTAGKKLLNEA